MSVIDSLLAANQEYAEGHPTALSPEPDHRLAILTCMDCRIEPLQELGLHLGSAHVIRNAGGLITDDAIRSLAISQHKLGTDAIMIIQHSRCGLTGFSDDEFQAELERQTHRKPPWSPQPFGDQDQNVRDALTTARSSPFLPRREEIRGFIFDVDTGLLHEVAS